MKIFIDTSAFYALLDRDDGNHPKGKKAWTKILGVDSTVVTSNYILLETFALLQSRIDGLVKSRQRDGCVKSFRCKARKT